MASMQAAAWANLLVTPGPVNAAGRMSLGVQNNDPRDLMEAVVVLRPAGLGSAGSGSVAEVETRLAGLNAGEATTYELMLPGSFIGKACEVTIKSAKFGAARVQAQTGAVETTVQQAAVQQAAVRPTERKTGSSRAQPQNVNVTRGAVAQQPDTVTGPAPLTPEDRRRRDTIRQAQQALRASAHLPEGTTFTAWNAESYEIRQTLAGTEVKGLARVPLMLGGARDVPFTVIFDDRQVVAFAEFDGLVEVDTRP